MKFPTRGDIILDKFFCNLKNTYVTEKLSPLKNSDHAMIYMKPIYKKKARIKLKPRKVKLLDKDGLECVRVCFSETNWEIFKTSCEDLNDLSDTISCYINFCTNLFTKTKTVKQFSNNHPWITKNVKSLIRERHRLYKKDSKYLSYQEKCRELNRAIRQAKLDYKTEIEENLKREAKISWNNIKIYILMLLILMIYTLYIFDIVAWQLRRYVTIGYSPINVVKSF